MLFCPCSRFTSQYLGKTIVAAAFFTSAASACLAGEVVDRIERTFPVKERPLIYVRNSDGRTTLRATSASEVHVVAVKEISRAASEEEGRREAARVEVRIEQVGSRVEVEAKYPKDWTFGDGRPIVLVHFDIAGPVASNLNVHSSDGELDADGFDGQLELSTSDGRLTASNCSGRIAAHASDGAIDISGARGTLQARTSDGKMKLEGTFTGLEVKSSDGRVDILARPGSTMENAWSIATSDGSIRLHLPEDFSADLDVSTGEGSINVEFPVAMSGGKSSKHHLTGKLNKGGPLLHVHASDGSVMIGK